MRLPLTRLSWAPASAIPTPDSAGPSSLAAQARVFSRIVLARIESPPAVPGSPAMPARTMMPAQLPRTRFATTLPPSALRQRMPKRLSVAMLPT
jgi:hypothetical protein